VIEGVSERTGGVPLFVEEVVRLLRQALADRAGADARALIVERSRVKGAKDAFAKERPDDSRELR
jgi:hypothetical protein